ncbi:uncharacterized protein F4822DRAFT_434163 [Hypoxylon trugodes]|uniref:uncharacterized protein n=1 Tax=Hypoxylon trugodes TaxID=326681 RepID=UPI0021999C57|nr:uncharacterized protein F4822DRAFT_434163 [Hypoxylon trugodes]KAI1384224.1 hypothetical protein F4822DRAFT_434163 [Hypoxylon trugodes]
MPARQIPIEEWERHKDRILGIYLRPKSSLKVAISEMRMRHNFNASKSQYETRLKEWGVCKYNTKRHKAQRHAMSLMGTTPQPYSIESNNSNWKHAIAIDTSHNSTRVSENIFTPLWTDFDLTTCPATPSAESGLVDVGAGLPPFAYPPTFDTGSQLIGSTSQARVNNDFLTPSFRAQNTRAEPQSYSQSNALNLYTNGVTFSGSPSLLAHPSSPIVGATNLTHPISGRLSWAVELPSSEILAMVAKSTCDPILPSKYRSSSSAHLKLSVSQYFMVSQITSDVDDFLAAFGNLKAVEAHLSTPYKQALGYLFSEELLIGEEQVMISSETTAETRCYGRLLRSIINGFTSLEDISATGILRFISQHKGMKAVLVGFLRSSSSFAAKSLAENTLRAALEADYVDITILLLDLPLIDVEKFVCYHEGERYTLLEYAAQSQSFKVLRLFIERRLNLNKSFSRFTALELLTLNYRGSQSTFDPEFLEVVERLVEAKAPVGEKLVRLISVRSFPPQLKAISIPALLQMPTEAFSGITNPSYIVQALGYCSVEVSESIINRFISLNGRRCLDECDEAFKYALAEATRRRDTKLVELLLPFCSSAGEVLEIAIDNGDKQIIKIILKRYPYLKYNVDKAEIIDAFKSGDQERMSMLESDGLFGCLTPYDLNELLCIALESYNLLWAEKLLEMDSTFRDVGLNEPLTIALLHGLDDFAWKLIEVGAEFGRGMMFSSRQFDGQKKRYQSPLYIAVKKRKLELAQAMIEYSISLGLFEGDRSSRLSLLREVIRWNDDFILRGIVEIIANMGVHSNLTSEAVMLAFEEGGQKLFWKIAKLCHKSTSSARLNILTPAVKSEDVEFLQEIIDFGADASDEGALLVAMTKHPTMVEPLLDRFRREFPRGKAGYGQGAVRRGIMRLPDNSEGLYAVLKSGLVDMNYPCGHYVDGHRLLTPRTLFGKAIEKLGERSPQEYDFELVEKIIDAGGDVNSITTGCVYHVHPSHHVRPVHPTLKQSALLDAIETRNQRIVELLLLRGACINEAASLGLKRTPLQKAAELGSLSIVRLLLEQGAEVNAAPAMFGGATALQLAAIGGHCDVAMELINHGADFNSKPSRGKHGRMPLEGAAEHGRLDMIQLLWNFGSSSIDEEQCKRAIGFAAYKGHFGCRDLIHHLMASRSTGTTQDFDSRVSDSHSHRIAGEQNVIELSEMDIGETDMELMNF